MNVDDYERYAHEQLEGLRREYELKAAPFVAMLCKINASRPPPRIVLTMDQLQLLGLPVSP